MHCILITRTAHRLAGAAEAVAHSHFERVTLIDQNDFSIDDATLAATPTDLLISFLNERILHESALARPNINFHPGPPFYPGRGGASRALYDGASSYGATCHVMSSKVDTGSILAVAEFPITPNDTCETIFARAEDASLELLKNCLVHFSAKGSLPEPCGARWSGDAFSRRRFEDWLIIEDPSDSAEVDRKVHAARHSKFPGPYIMIGKHRFGLVNETRQVRLPSKKPA